MSGLDEERDLIENVECVTIKGTRLTPNHVEGKISELRKRYFDLPLYAAPVVSESKYSRHASQLTEAEKEILDNAPYDFDMSTGEKRFRTEFDYFSALIRASEDNASQVAQLKRKMTYTWHAIRARYADVYDMCLHDYGSKTMGANQQERTSWFHSKYPALFEIERAYSDFLDEIEIELERWDNFSAGASRQLTATEASYKATGRMYDRKPGKYVFDD